MSYYDEGSNGNVNDGGAVVLSDTVDNVPNGQIYLKVWHATAAQGTLSVVTRAGTTMTDYWVRGIPMYLRVKRVRSTGSSSGITVNWYGITGGE